MRQKDDRDTEGGRVSSRSPTEGGTSVKRFERSNGLDTAVYKNLFFLQDSGQTSGDVWDRNVG